MVLSLLFLLTEVGQGLHVVIPTRLIIGSVDGLMKEETIGGVFYANSKKVVK